jgi:sugar phosphate permease
LTWLILTAGWRTTYVLIAGGFLALVLPLCLWVVRDSPESMGLRADGAAQKPGACAVELERQ